MSSMKVMMKHNREEMESGLRFTGHRVTGSAILAGRVGSWVSVSDPVFDPVLMHATPSHLGKLISAVSVSVRFPSQHYWFTYFS